MSDPLRIGTRGSDLALYQARRIARLIEERLGRTTRLEIITTQGDQDTSRPVAELGAVGVFTKELELALLDHRADVAVHSLKDLPTVMPEGLHLAARPERVQVHDVLIAHPDAFDPTQDIPLRPGARVGTASVRRRIQLRTLRDDLEVVPIRGNVPTRVDKVRTREVDAVVLAAAGVDRLELDLSELRRRDLSPLMVLPAPGQGALALQTRADDHALNDALAQLDDPHVAQATDAERAVLHGLGAGCSVPLGALASTDGPRTDLRACLGPEDPHAPPSLRTVWVRHREPERASKLALRLLRDDPFPDAPPNALQHVRVLIARDPERAEDLAQAITRAGGTPICRPAAQRVPRSDTPTLLAALARLQPGDAVLFASANAVHRCAELMGPEALAQALTPLHIAAVGRATARALGHLGAPLDTLGEGTGEDLARALLSVFTPPKRALLPAALHGRPEAHQTLSQANCDAETLHVYETVPHTTPPDFTDIHALILASPSGAEGTLPPTPLPDLKIVAIGPTTAAAVEALGHTVAATAAQPTPASLFEALLSLYA